VVIGANGVVEGDIHGQQADIMGKVTGTIKVKDLLQLKGGSMVNGNLQAAKLQIEPTPISTGNVIWLLSRQQQPPARLPRKSGKM